MELNYYVMSHRRRHHKKYTTDALINEPFCYNENLRQINLHIVIISRHLGYFNIQSTSA